MTSDTPEEKPSASFKIKEKPPKLAECRSSAITQSDTNSNSNNSEKAERCCRPRAYSMHTKTRLSRKERSYCNDISNRRCSLPASALIENFLAVPGLNRNKMDSIERSDDSGSEEEGLRRARSLKGERSDNGREPLRRVRSFKTTSKGLINRGDSFKKRRNRSHTGFKVSDDGNDYRDQRNHLNPADACTPQATIPTVSINTTGSVDQNPNHFRVLVLGVPGVGKTLLTDQFMTSEFLGNYEYSISQSEEDRTVTLLVDGDESTIEFLDNEGFEDELETYILDGYVVVYSLTDKTSFETAVDIVDNLRQEVGPEKAVILVANKSDLVRKKTVSSEDGRMMADKYGCKYIETSAALNHRVDELLVGILKQILLKSSGCQSEERTPTNDVKSKDKDRKGSFKKTKHFLEKIFRRSGAKSKEKTTCENLYVD